MSSLSATLITLIGALLCIAGVVAILVSGVDPLISGVGLAAGAVGGAGIWYGNRYREKPEDGDAAPGGRSKPPAAPENPRAGKWQPPTRK